MENYTEFELIGSNVTSHQDHVTPAVFVIGVIVAVIIILFDVLIVVCNIFMLAVLHHPQIQDIGEVNIFLFRVMAIVDIFGGLASTTFHLYSEPSFFNREDEPSAELCLLLLFFCFYSANLSVWLQCLITINKYIMVSHPLRYPTLVDVKRFAITLSVCALISLNCASFLPIPSFPYTASGMFFCRDGIFKHPNLSLDLGILVACIACPALITSLLNIRLLAISISFSRKVCAQDALTNESSSADHPGNHRRRPNFHGIKTIILLVITSYFYVVFSALFLLTHPLLLSELLHATVGNLLYLMSLSSFWWKLFVLIMTNVLFRNVAKKVWSDFKSKFTQT